ncbi:hypothetical protein PPN88_17545 [Proteus mirabilis]|uniref:hypothetical protein n=1 Tax=Proteus mirabilis TaxID=584 RepID=UPI00234B5297|nr:hypothetical protein [Proteus mirabilis]MDC5952775.1 hypothetical protein [Proteus mirabilis]
MIYTTGTVSTVSGSAIVSGTGTKWTVNNPAIRAGTLILIKNGNMNYPYMVDRVIAIQISHFTTGYIP